MRVGVEGADRLSALAPARHALACHEIELIDAGERNRGVCVHFHAHTTQIHVIIEAVEDVASACEANPVRGT